VSVAVRRNPRPALSWDMRTSFHRGRLPINEMYDDRHGRPPNLIRNFVEVANWIGAPSSTNVCEISACCCRRFGCFELNHPLQGEIDDSEQRLSFGR
jgi:hypothetical protein